MILFITSTVGSAENYRMLLLKYFCLLHVYYCFAEMGLQTKFTIWPYPKLLLRSTLILYHRTINIVIVIKINCPAGIFNFICLFHVFMNSVSLCVRILGYGVSQNQMIINDIRQFWIVSNSGRLRICPIMGYFSNKCVRQIDTYLVLNK